jgi:hypothetical protein
MICGKLQIDHIGIFGTSVSLPVMQIRLGRAGPLLMIISCCKYSTQLPPSPPGNWPIIVLHLHLMGPAAKSMAELSQKYGPLMFLQLGTKSHM